MNFKHLHYFWRVAKAGGMARASEQLHITPPTLSGQIGLLEGELGVPLFAKRGRNVELTDAGRFAFGYAEDIFAMVTELDDSLRQFPDGGYPVEFRVGVSDSVPKSIAYRLLEPATRLPTPVRIVCRESKLDSLIAELAMNRLDLVISGSPIPPSVSVRAFNHRLGQSGVSFFASPQLLESLKGDFPVCLADAPMLLPGAGVFIAPTVLEFQIEKQYAVKVLGRAEEIIEEFFAISVERRLTHPCVVAIHEMAKTRLFPTGDEP